MDTQEALTFAAAAPFVLVAMTLLTNMIPVKVPAEWNPLISFVLTTLWGLVLVQGDYWNGTVASFVVTDLTVTYAVIGLRSQVAHAGVEISKLSGQEPPVAR